MAEGKGPQGRIVPEHVRRMLAGTGSEPPAEAAPGDAGLAPGAGGMPAAPSGGVGPAPGAAGVETASAPGRTGLEPAELTGPAAAIREQAAALHKQAIMDLQAGHSDAARTHLEESLALEQGIGVPADVAATSIMLGQV